MSVVIEGRRIDTKLYCEPFKDDGGEAWRRRVTIGSRNLRDAILLAQGITPPADRQAITVPTKPTIPVRAEVHEPRRCPTCNAPMQPQRMLIAHIQAAVTSYFGLPSIAMTSSQRKRDYSGPRQIAMYLASELTNKSLVDIGKRFGGRDHTTVIHAIKSVEQRIANDPETALDVRALREALEG